MAYPRVEKTWQEDTGRDMGRTFGPAAEELHPQFFLNVINAWLGFPLHPPQVWGSSDSITAGMDRVNRWVDAEDLVWIESGTPFVETDPRSWIVLRVASGVQILFHLIGTGTGSVHVVISKAGFTGGSITACPTAIDGSTIGLSATDTCTWNANLDNTGTNRLQMFHSTDGRETRFFFTRASDQPLVHGYAGGWVFGELADAPRSITKPFFAFFDKAYSTDLGMYQMTVAKRTAVFLPAGPGFATYMTEHSYVLDQLPALLGVGPCMQGPNEISGEWPIQPIYIYDSDTGATLGRVKDLWLGSSAVTQGTTFPEGGPSQFAQFGALVVPWPAEWGTPVTGPLLEFDEVTENAYNSTDGVTGPIVVAFTDTIDPDSVVAEVMGLTGDAAPESTFIVRHNSYAATLTVEVVDNTIVIHSDLFGDQFGPEGQDLHLRIYLTTGIRSTGGTALQTGFAVPVKDYHVNDNSD